MLPTRSKQRSVIGLICRARAATSCEWVDEYDGHYKTVIDLTGDEAQVSSLCRSCVSSSPGVSTELEETLERPRRRRFEWLPRLSVDNFSQICSTTRSGQVSFPSAWQPGLQKFYNASVSTTNLYDIRTGKEHQQTEQRARLRGGIVTTTDVDVDYTKWDWLPQAAVEIQDYLARLLVEASINPHDISARPKLISSFQDKCKQKGYDDPVEQVTDTVAARIITYSITDRDRVAELIRGRLVVKPGEDKCPGDGRPHGRRGYDCRHIVVSGESPDSGAGWLILGGKLARYFDEFGGLEIQVRTVAAHAWAEFEHERRYKSVQYGAIGQKDQETIDQLFGAAADARSALDETFVAIDRLLANPTVGERPVAPSDSSESVDDRATPVDSEQMTAFLADRFPDAEVASDNGVWFACELVLACGLSSIEALEAALDAVDSEQVQSLMSTTRTVTRVRRLDDELLACYGQQYIENTGDVGLVKTRQQQLEWRYDRLRGKTRYSMYSLQGADCPEHLRSTLLPAARVVREVARIVADSQGVGCVSIPDAVSSTDDLPERTRPKSVRLSNGASLWVATNLNRASSEALTRDLLSRADSLDLQVLKEGEPIQV